MIHLKWWALLLSYIIGAAMIIWGLVVYPFFTIISLLFILILIFSVGLTTSIPENFFDD